MQHTPKPGRLARYAQVALWIFAVGAVAALCLADLLPQWLATRSQPYLTLAVGSFIIETLQFHIGAACLLCLAVAVAGKRWRLALVSAMGVVMGLAPTASLLITREAPAPAGATMRLMSMNVHVHNRNAAAVLASVRRAKPDVLALQEYSVTMDDAIRDELADEYPYQLRKPRQNSGDGWAIYSRRPLLAPIDTSLRLDQSKRQARFAVRMGDKEVVIYALHLTSPQSVEQIGRNRAEVADLLELVAQESMPVILAGDFNFTETTANAAALRALGLRNTHDLAGSGRGSTWRYRKLGITHRLPGFRIDHVFIGPQLTCTHSRVLDTFGSDHRPIIADIALAAPEMAERDEAVASVE
ncbi:MAG TPA: endonuclease/exonuclease/phosphatase family protein [Tepidisphaeraceae bacterium]|nr:endonuclease/exonuclease/phosphatase family protein [Tepidisphaeraceae bacterium]